MEKGKQREACVKRLNVLFYQNMNLPKPELRDDGNTAVLIGTGQVLIKVHAANSCKNQYCCIHNPSNHHMVTWPQAFVFSLRRMERLCQHNVGHPDPDEISTNTEHHCDGCCQIHLKVNRRAAIQATRDKK